MGFRRYRYPGQSYFFTVVTASRKPIFRDDNAVALLRAAMAEVRSRHPFTIDAAVVLPDHLHMIWSLPAEDRDHSQRWRRIKSIFTRACGLPRPVWQARYWEHMLRDEDDWERHIAYILWNPVKHGLVAQPQDWPWSSIHMMGTIPAAPPEDFIRE